MFQKLLDIISKILPVNPIAGKEDLLAQLNPKKIYVENVRALLDVSTKTAEEICETATRQGYFRKYVEVMCPDGSVAKTPDGSAAFADSEDRLPETVICVDDEYGEPEEVPIPSDTLKKSVFYTLNEKASVVHA